MGQIDAKIMEIREYFKEFQSEKFAIENSLIKGKDEYLKSLYMQALATVVQYENDTAEGQVLFLQRVANGICCERSVEDYMRKSLDISLVEVKEFMDAFRDDDTRYYFTVNGIILAALGERREQNYAYLSELVQMLGITLNELQYLSKVAKSVLMQSSEIYDEAKRRVPESAGCVNFFNYIGNFYAGAVVDNDRELVFTAPERQVVSSLEKGGMEFQQRKVIFTGIEINIKGDWKFQGCEEVRFENCGINGQEGSLYLNGVGCFHMEGCTVQNFDNTFAYLNSVGKVMVLSNELNNCGRMAVGMQYYDDKEGGGAFCYWGKCNEIVFQENLIQKCYIKRNDGSNTRINGAFFGKVGAAKAQGKVKRLELVRNTFVGGECNVDDAGLILKEEIKEIIQDGNVIKGGIPILISSSW